jgi:2,3-bisphosphoglycerate-independent phosphoglycerate mutase
MISNKPVVLCVLDGWGIGKDSDGCNAISGASPEWFYFLQKEFPSSQLITSGLSVGLPEGQMGNSEVGHMTLGSGRVIMQDLVRINSELSQVLDGEEIRDLVENLHATKKSCHLIGLASDGGVHSHIEHLIAIAKHLAKSGVRVHLHLIMDGRDTSPKSGKRFIKKLEEATATFRHCATHVSPTTEEGGLPRAVNNDESGMVHISTISGRYFAMDRDNRFDRTKKAFEAIVMARGAIYDEPIIGVEASYAEGKFDEFIEPVVLNGYEGMEDGDAVIFCNFRADRMRQICAAILDKKFTGFEREKMIRFSKALTLTSYSEELEKFAIPWFPQIFHKNVLSEVLNSQNIASLRIAETEKYAHVTFFFDAGREIKFPSDKRVLVPSPKVSTYDKKPEMSAAEITSVLLSELGEKKYDFILVNYANPDMVGHTGDYNATVQAIKAVDDCLGKLYNGVVKEMDGTLIIVSDHGNAEQMLEHDGSEHHTAHTTNPVPFIIVNKRLQGNVEANLRDGSLSDVAPTILSMLGIEKPGEMTGQSLLNYKKIYADV